MIKICHEKSDSHIAFLKKVCYNKRDFARPAFSWQGACIFKLSDEQRAEEIKPNIFIRRNYNERSIYETTA